LIIIVIEKNEKTKRGKSWFEKEETKYNGEKKNDKQTNTGPVNTTQWTKDRTTQTPL
jgi:hypothetical protein